LEALGRSVYEGGKQRFLDWQAAMKGKLGDLWESFKAKMRDIWNKIKGPMLNDRGKIDIEGIVNAFKKDKKGFEKVLNPKDMSVFERVFSSPAWLRERYPSMEAAFSRQMKRQEDRMTMMHESLKQNEPAIDLKKNPKEFVKLKELIWRADGRKFKGINESRFVWEDKEIKGLNLKHYNAVEAAVKKMGYSDAVTKAFIAVRKDMDRDLIRVYRAMKRMPDIEESTIDEFRKAMGMVQNYFPHHRYGNYYIRGFGKDGEVLYRGHFNDLMTDSPRAKGLLSGLRKEYPDVVKWETGKNAALPEDVYSFPIPVEAMEQIIKAAASRIDDPGLRKTFEEIMPEAISDTMKSRGFGSHMIKRENIPGFEKDDILRVLYDYKAGLAGWLTKMQAAHDFSAMLRSIDAKKSPEEWSYVSRYVRDMLQNTDRLDRAADTVRALVYLKFIAGNVKTGVVNLTQNLIAGIPVLSMETSGAGFKWIKAGGDDLLGYLMKKKNLKPDEAKLLDELYTDGTNRDNFTQELKGRMTGGLVGLNKALDILGLTMSIPEKFNRASLSLAAYRAARDGKITRKETLAKMGLNLGEKATYEQARDFARRIVERSHFVYGKANLAEPLRGTPAGKIARALYALQSFTHNLLQLWGYMLRSGGRGYQAFAKSLLAQLAVGGFLAIPLIKTFAWAMRKYLGTDPQEEIRKRIPKGPEGNENLYRDMVIYGLPGMVGVDITGSIGIDLPNFKSNPIAGIAGAPYSMFVEAPIKAADAISYGAPGRAAEFMAPTAVANALAAHRMYSEGRKTVAGKIQPIMGEAEPQKITKIQAILKGFGFQPTSVSKATEARQGLKELEAFAKAKQRKFINRFANAYPDDLKEMSKITEEVRDWNEKMVKAGKPEFVVSLKSVRERLRPGREPRKFRGYAAERMELYK
ncbi:MAG TPA: PLxRFG domain-containing protein, partial [Acidobacteriota bacterium]|nr:PLxRFG domain-containing protein [Acidobacteriota bacterium]